VCVHASQLIGERFARREFGLQYLPCAVGSVAATAAMKCDQFNVIMSVDETSPPRWVARGAWPGTVSVYGWTIGSMTLSATRLCNLS
jgi:hypothetical protein